MKSISTHILLKRITEAPPQAWQIIDLVARDFTPKSDEASSLDWEKLMTELGSTLGSLAPAEAQPPDPNWLRKTESSSQITDYPKVQNV